MTPVVIVNGIELKPLDTIARVGSSLGLNRTTSFKRAASWPIDGELGERLVIVQPLMDRLGIPYSVELRDKEATA